MKKIMFSGLPTDISEEQIRSALAKFGAIKQIFIIKDGDPNQPVAVVEIDLNDSEAFDLASRVTDLWHDGHRINAWVLRH
jgi:hypothetical protein